MSIEVVDWSPHWAEQFEEVAAVRDVLRSAALQEVLEASGELTRSEMDEIRRLNGA